MRIQSAFVSVLSFLVVTWATADRIPTATIDVLAYADVYDMEPSEADGQLVGGPSRVVPIVQHMRESNPNSLVLFSGDTMSPSLWSSHFHGMQMVEVHNAIGIDAACLGNHDFDYGLDGFLKVAQASKFPWLNANVFDKKTNKLIQGTQANTIISLKDKDGNCFKVGIFGVMYELNSKSSGAYWTNPIKAAKKQVRILRRREKVDMVIALTHQTALDDELLATSVKGIDVIYGGHDHVSMLQEGQLTPYIKPEQDFRSIWTTKLEYFAKQKGTKAHTKMTHTSLAIVEDMPTDPVMDSKIAVYAQEMESINGVKVGELCRDLDVQKTVVRYQDCDAGHLFADSFLHLYDDVQPDAAVMNGGGIRGDKVLPAGDLTIGDVNALSPFSNLLVVCEASGASLKQFVTYEMQASCGDGALNANGYFVHPGGFKYTFECTGNDVGELTSIEWHLHPSRSGAVQDDESIIIAMSEFIYTTEFVEAISAESTLLIGSNEAKLQNLAVENFIKNAPENTICFDEDSRVTITTRA